MHPLAVTLLYVPADRTDRVRKALASDTDTVIIDLEDAVAATQKEAARDALPHLLAEQTGPSVQIRVNGTETRWGQDDLNAVAELPGEIEIRLPKVETPRTVAKAVAALGTDRPIHCLLESALGVEHALDIAQAAPSVASIGLGEADLRSNLGVTNDAGLLWSRGRVVVAARAACLPPPAQSVYTAVRDLDGLMDSCRAGRALGFVGRCAIHPAQLPVIRAAFRPSDYEVDHAREVLRHMETAQEAGGGISVLDSGDFVDEAMVAGARRVLALEERTRPNPTR